MYGRVQDHPLYRHLERVIDSKAEIPGFVGASLAEQRFLDWVKAYRRLSEPEWLKVFGDIQRDPATSVMVVLRGENPESRQIIDNMLESVPHDVLIWGQGSFPWPPISLPKE